MRNNLSKHITALCVPSGKPSNIHYKLCSAGYITITWQLTGKQGPLVCESPPCEKNWCCTWRRRWKFSVLMSHLPSPLKTTTIYYHVLAKRKLRDFFPTYSKCFIVCNNSHKCLAVVWTKIMLKHVWISLYKITSALKQLKSMVQVLVSSEIALFFWANLNQLMSKWFLVHVSFY